MHPHSVVSSVAVPTEKAGLYNDDPNSGTDRLRDKLSCPDNFSAGSVVFPGLLFGPSFSSPEF